MLRSLLLFLVLLTGGRAAAEAPTRDAVSHSLDGASQCVPFTWAGDAARPRMAIIVPVVVNGRTLPFQLDTGADVTISYGDLADKAGWATAGAESWRAAAFSIGSTPSTGPNCGSTAT